MANIRTFDFSVNLLKALLWEYGTVQPNLQSILSQKQTWYDGNQETFWQDWFTNVFDLRTCNDFGCNVWAIILGLPLNLIITTPGATRLPWGFSTANPTNFDGYNFNQFNSQVTLTLAQKRLILQLRARQLVAKPTIPEINKILADLVAPALGAPCYMIDNYNMTQTLICKAPIPSQLQLILTEFDVIPRGQGVSMTVVSQP